nr:Gag-Pol polyprotein [Tanacetum cinerariifolium]
MTPTVDLEQGSKKSALEILQINMEQAEKQQKPKFTIKSTDKEALEEYDLKGSLYQSMHTNKSFNRNTSNYRFYHALMEPLIEDENAIDKGVANTIKDHKRKDDDDKDPPARPNQDDDVVHDDQPQDTLKPKIRKTLNPDWFKQPRRPPTPDLEWNKRQVVLNQPAQPWFSQMVSSSKDTLTFNDLMATSIDFSKYMLNGIKIENLTQDILLGPAFNMLKGTCSSSIELEYNFQECFNESKFSKQNVYSTKAILGMKSVSVKKLHKYGHFEEIVVKRYDQQLYKFKEGDFVDLHLNDIEDMLLLLVQHKLFHLDGSVIVDFSVALCTSSVNKSSSPTNNSKQQETPPTTNIQSSTELTTPTKTIQAEENNDNQAVDTQFQPDEFINPFCTSEEVYVTQPNGLVDPDHPEKVYRLRKALWIEASSKSLDPGFELTAFPNANHVGCLDTRKSTSRGIQFLGDNLVSWMSKKQDCTAISSVEAEYVALSASCAQRM